MSDGDDIHSKIDAYYTKLFVKPDSALDGAKVRIDDHRLPPISVPALHGQFLMMLAKMTGAKRILEIGTLGGYSTLWLAKALPADGRIISLEIRDFCADIAQKNIDAAGMSKQVDIRCAPALESLDAMIAGGEAPFDFVFIDADKPNYHRYLERVLKLTRTGSIIIADNVVLSGDIIEENSENHGVRAIRTMNTNIAANPRLSATMIQTINAKGLDGFTMMIVD